jgi:Tfp pilus assembly protein FimT
VIAVTGLLVMLGLPRLGDALDRLAVDRATSDVTMAIAVARSLAVSMSTRARVVIREDSLVVDTLGRVAWGTWRVSAGAAAHGVSLRVSNRVIVFGGDGVGWGASNTSIVLSRGSHTGTVTVSRLGRVKRR